MKIEQRKIMQRMYEQYDSCGFPINLERIFQEFIENKDSVGLSKFIQWIAKQNKNEPLRLINYYKYKG